MFAPGAKRKSDFFRDIAGSRYLAIGETVAKEAGLRYDMLLNVFDRSIIEVENRVYGDSVRSNLRRALDRTLRGAARGRVVGRRRPRADRRRARDRARGDLRASAPATAARGCRSPKEHIRSEILCHGLGAHVMYPRTRDRARHRRPGHQGDPGRPARASSTTSR